MSEIPRDWVEKNKSKYMHSASPITDMLADWDARSAEQERAQRAWGIYRKHLNVLVQWSTMDQNHRDAWIAFLRELDAFRPAKPAKKLASSKMTVEAAAELVESACFQRCETHSQRKANVIEALRQVIDFAPASDIRSTGTKNDPSSSPIFCEHANESPRIGADGRCRCDDDCYCKVRGGCRERSSCSSFCECDPHGDNIKYGG